MGLVVLWRTEGRTYVCFGVQSMVSEVHSTVMTEGLSRRRISGNESWSYPIQPSITS